MDHLLIQGGTPLSGETRIGGAKNAVLPALAATVLAADTTTLLNVPGLRDVDGMMAILRGLGAAVREELDGGQRAITVDARNLASSVIPDELMRQMRSSIFIMGALLARCGEVTVTQPGGCSIGPRPIDLHISGLRRMGAEIEEAGGHLRARARRLRGADITLTFPSVGATENLMMAATLAEGTTVIRNAAREPEIVDLAQLLTAMGARIQGAGSDIVEVRGVRRLRGATHRIIPDRIEAGTYLLAIAATGGDGAVTGARPDHLDALLAFLRDTGATVETDAERIRVRGPERPQAADLRTLPYPGFPTDLQNPALAYLLRADGTSVVTETVFESRFRVADELRRMGASLHVDGRTAIVRGVPRLTGAWVEAHELRGGAALVIAALSAEGESRIDGVAHIDRGYERIEEKLKALGARIRRRLPGQ
ncbi:MAG: UDP-N-acetylglucosamine 1-carboxyvinyltransferase [Clostridia bacterium]|nr:UDP-N-acetylglucosamine 1-carboxyvinyltransferase [Clostridia bacterium]